MNDIRYTLDNFLMYKGNRKFRYMIPEGTDKASKMVNDYMMGLIRTHGIVIGSAAEMHLVSQKLDNILMMIDRK